MNIFSWILIILSILYGGLTILGGVTQLEGKEINFSSSIIMIIGGTLVILSVLAYFVLYSYGIYVLIAGLLIIHVSALDNGFKMYGKITLEHQVVRLIFSILVITLFLVK